MVDSTSPFHVMLLLRVQRKVRTFFSLLGLQRASGMLVCPSAVHCEVRISHIPSAVPTFLTSDQLASVWWNVW